MRVRNADLEIKRAAQLSVIEISLGSIGHGFHFPLTGHVLSLNQLAFLLNAINHDQLMISSTFEISSIAAVLKSFSPAGAKLGPMLSISVQGFLFWLCCSLSRGHVAGQVVGAVVMSLWAFIQPLLSYIIVFGLSLVSVISFYETRIKKDYAFIAQSILVAIAFVVLLKILIAISLVIYSVITKKAVRIIEVGPYLKKYSSVTQPRPAHSAWKAALQDILRPLFAISFILLLFFISQLESSFSEKIWIALRPLAIAFILFYLIRSHWVAEKLRILSTKSRFVERIYAKSKTAFNLMAEGATGSSKVSSGRQSK
ncbi:MAG: hypothetical protein H7061_02375 [Bdellovibrionaceae bacterium]|nr:hypothetical protein [Bdellovibrio sp.]